MEQQEIDRERIAGDYRNSIIASVEHDEASAKVPDDQNLREAYQEEGRRLDENESGLKEQYEENGCEEQTGLSADGYRHQVISDYTAERFATQDQEAQEAQAYWSNEQGNVVAEDLNSNLAAIGADQDVATNVNADNSVSNENSL